MSMREQIESYCTELASDPLLVQGAGGNVSWKEDDVLWVKASGTWLAQAEEKDIFVPVNLPLLQSQAADGDFSSQPEMLADSGKPSIETCLHALMPHRIVVHVHAVSALSWLVREDSEFDRLLMDDWRIISYKQPGAALAAQVHETLQRHPHTSTLLLRNHGVVVGGDDIETVDLRLRKVAAVLERKTSRPSVTVHSLDLDDFRPARYPENHALAQDPVLLKRLRDAWALYPDHVVFLGPRAPIVEELSNLDLDAESPLFFILPGVGTYVSTAFTEAHEQQLRCYHDVLARQPEAATLNVLPDREIAALLDWDAERYRQQMGH